MIPKKPAPDVIRGVQRFLEKHALGLTRGIMLKRDEGSGLWPARGEVVHKKTNRRYSRDWRRRSELTITLTEDSAIAAAAMIGDSNMPNKG
jgi:hypothetical protein